MSQEIYEYEGPNHFDWFPVTQCARWGYTGTRGQGQMLARADVI